MGSDGGQAQSVRFWRLNAGLTLEEVAVRAHLSRATVVKLERGERSTLFDHEAERRVAVALGVEPSMVAWGVDGDAEPRVGLRALREQSGLSEGQVAAAACVAVRTLRRAEAGAAIHPRYAKAIADYWQINVTDFYPRERRRAA